MQIIAGAMCMGVLFFMLISVFIVQSTPPRGPVAAVPLFTYVGFGLTVFIFFARMVVRHVMLASALKSLARGTWKQGATSMLSFAFPVPTMNSAPPPPTDDIGRLLSIFRTRLIVGAAMIEAPAFFLLVSYNVERRIEAVALAALLLGGMLLQIPTTTGVSHWITEQLQAIEQMRRDGENVRA